MENLTKKVVCDFILLSVVAFPILILRIFMQPYRRGFFCDDETIRHPYKESTVSSFALYLVGMGLPICTIVMIEWTYFRRNSLEGVGNKSSTYVFGWRIPLFCVKLYNTIGVFCFGAACQQLITDIGKYSIGRLRPHFIDVCNPNVNCTNTIFQLRYIEDYLCQSRNLSLEREARLSFPSGHSSFSSYCMVYLAIYLQYKFNWKGSYLIKHFLQFCCFALTWYTALSRISDYKHHPTDVLSGLFIGITTAILTTGYVSRFQKTSMKQKTASDNISHSS